MSIALKVAVEQVWSINDLGFIEVDVVAVEMDDYVRGPLALDAPMIIGTLLSEIEECEEHDIQFDPLLWVNLKNQFIEMAERIDLILVSETAE